MLYMYYSFIEDIVRAFFADLYNDCYKMLQFPLWYVSLCLYCICLYSTTLLGMYTDVLHRKTRIYSWYYTIGTGLPIIS